MSVTLQNAVVELKLYRDQIDVAIRCLESICGGSCPVAVEAPETPSPIKKNGNVGKGRKGMWTPERENELWTMYENKTKVREIANHFDTSGQTIYNQITRLKKERQ